MIDVVKHAREYMASPDARESVANILVAKLTEEVERLRVANEIGREALRLTANDLRRAVREIERELQAVPASTGGQPSTAAQQEG